MTAVLTRVVLSFVLAPVLAVVLAACSEASGKAPEATEPPPPVTVDTVDAQGLAIPEVLRLEGTLAARRHAMLSPRVSGHVAKVRVEKGSIVRSGDALIELDAKSFQLAARSASARAQAQRDQLGAFDPSAEVDVDGFAEVVSARADWENASDQLRRIEPLEASGAIDARSLEQARSQEAAAKARLDAAKQRARAAVATYEALSADAAQRQKDASDAIVRAPFDGAVVDRKAEVGEFVGPQTPVVELVDDSELRLEIQVPERSVGRLRVGQPAKVSVDGTQQVVDGVVRHLAAALDATRRTLAVEIAVPNSDRTLRAGHFARAEIALDGRRTVVRLPSEAVRERAGVLRVFVVKDGVAEARIVESVERLGDVMHVIGDIAVGEKVVENPPRTLADGAAVRVEG